MHYVRAHYSEVNDDVTVTVCGVNSWMPIAAWDAMVDRVNAQIHRANAPNPSLTFWLGADAE